MTDNRKIPRFVMDGTPIQETKPNAETLLRTQRTAANIGREHFSAASLKKLSDVRKAEILQMKDGSKSSKTGNMPSVVGVGLGKKEANFGAIGSNAFGAVGGGVDRILPEIYSPLFQVANLNLPRDRMTMNAWNRNFYDTHPIVRNAITLHSTYPISKINVKCKHRKVEQFFEDMCERINLFDAIAGVAQQFWCLGEAFPFAELDENTGMWSSVVVQNPDYVNVQKSGASNIPVISIRPDEIMKKIVSSNNPVHIKLRAQIPDSIIHHIKKGEPFPADNFNISHLKMLSAPYDVRGTSMLVSCYKMLMWWDFLLECELAQAQSLINPLTIVTVGGTQEGEFHPQGHDLEEYKQIFECYDEETEVLTDQGFKKYDEVMTYKKEGKEYIATPKPGIKIACFNNDSNELEYHTPNAATLYDYSGKMYHFANTKIDVKVTPNHDMWISKKQYNYNGHRSLRTTSWMEWEKVKASEIDLNDYTRTRTMANWTGETINYVDVLGKMIPIQDYLEYLGYVLSEGCLYGPTNSIIISQTMTKYQSEMKKSSDKFAEFFSIKSRDRIRLPNQHKNQKEIWTGTISYKPLYEFLRNEVGDENGRTLAEYKRIPRYLLNLKSELLKILLDALVKGDGSIKPRSNSTGYAYYTTSKQLADDVYELVYKCGYTPTMFVRTDMGENKLPLYTLGWSTTENGKFPQLCRTYRNSQTKEKTNMLNIEHYKGKVWCFNVPTGLFITRRNGKITIHGNSAQNDKDFKIITHAGMKVERVGASGAVINTADKFNFIREMLYAGLMVPKAVMDTEGSAYASASVGLEVLRTRYFVFRNMLEQWLEKKIFAPISQIQGFFEYKNGEKVLIVPEVDWNHINLYDLTDYIQAIIPFVEKGRISTHTLYRSLGLNWEEEQRLTREEIVRATIMRKEAAELDKMSLVELRGLDPDEPIVEITKEEEPVPGQTPEVPGAEGEEQLTAPPQPTDMGAETAPTPAPEEGGGMGETPLAPAAPVAAPPKKE